MIDIHLTDQVDVSFDLPMLTAFLEDVLSDLHQDVDSVGIILADHDFVHALNKDYLSHDYRTDVISFTYSEAHEALCGEVYIDIETAREQAMERGLSELAEVVRYSVHGLLHLVGHDDQSTEEREAMRLLEDAYLATYPVPL